MNHCITELLGEVMMSDLPEGMSKHECTYNGDNHNYDDSEGYILFCSECGKRWATGEHSWNDLLDRFGIYEDEYEAG